MDNIIAVGYNVSIPENITTIIHEKRPEIDMSKVKLEKTVSSGVWYCENAPTQKPDSVKKQSELRRWYESRKDKKLIGYIRRIYVMPFVVVLEMDCGHDTFYCIPYNTGKSTTMHKINALRGHYGKPIDIDRIDVPVVAYIYSR
jgi:hypothetical protein